MSEVAAAPAPVVADASGAAGNPAVPADTSKGVEGSADKATADAIRKFKVKINDVEEEVSEEDLIAGYQTRKSSDAKFQEAANLRKQAEQFVHMLKTDPVKLLTHPSLGHDMRKLAEEYLGKQLQEDLMDPKDKEIRDVKAKLQEYEEQKKALENEEHERQATALREQYIDDYTKDFIPALNTAGLPKSEMTVRRMAYYTHAALKQGIKLPAVNAAELVKQDYIKEQQALYGSLDGDMLIELLGPDIAKKIRKYDVAKLKGGNTLKTSTGVELKSTETPAKKKTLTKDEWKQKMDRIRSGQE